MSGFGFHPEARDDLDEIRAFIAQHSPDNADRMVDRILDSVAALVKYPEQGHRRPDLTSRPLRFCLVYDYLIAYAPKTRPLWVLAILHGRRNPRVLAAILRGRPGYEAQ